MNSALESDKSSSIHRDSAPLGGFATVLLFSILLAAPVASSGAELKKETLRSWDAYVQAAKLRAESGRGPFLQVEGAPDQLQHVRQGEVQVSSVGQETPKHIPSGLIHDWIGTVFIPHTTLDGVFSAVRDYGDYKDFYKPTIVDSKLLAANRACDTYTMRVVNKEAVAEAALDMQYETCYFRVDEQRWYSVTRTTRVQEIRDFGKADEQELPPDEGSGYIWRLYSVARFKQTSGGVYVEVEALALSRDIPVTVRWLVNPIVRRVSRNSMLLSLQQTGDAVRSTVAANKQCQPSVAARDRSPGTVH